MIATSIERKAGPETRLFEPLIVVSEVRKGCGGQ